MGEIGWEQEEEEEEEEVEEEGERVQRKEEASQQVWCQTAPWWTWQRRRRTRGEAWLGRDSGKPFLLLILLLLSQLGGRVTDRLGGSTE